MARSDDLVPFYNTFFGSTPEDPPFMYGDRMAVSALKSLNYVAGSAGWMISQDGEAEFNDITIRGTLQSDNFVAGSAGWRLLDTGAAEFSEVTIRGSSVLAGADITGNLTMTGSGKIRTAASGERLEISTTNLSRIDFFPPDDAFGALDPGYIEVDQAGGTGAYIAVRAPEGSNGGSTNRGQITVRTGVTNGFHGLNVGTSADEDQFMAIGAQSTDSFVQHNVQTWLTSDTKSMARIVAGYSGFGSISDVETFQAFGTAAGYRMVERDATSDHWVVYANADHLRFWDGADRAAVQRSTGAVIAAAHSNGAAYIGNWQSGSSANWTVIANKSRYDADTDGGYALLLGGTSGDANTYINCPAGGQIVFERDGNGSDVNLIANLPTVAGPDPTVHISNASSQLLRNSSSRKFKKDIRTAKTSVVWDIRPVTYRWKVGVVGAAESNARYPDGIGGFIAEELAEVRKDLATYDENGDAATPHDRAILAEAIAGLHELKARIETLEGKSA